MNCNSYVFIHWIIIVVALYSTLIHKKGCSTKNHGTKARSSYVSVVTTYMAVSQSSYYWFGYLANQKFSLKVVVT